MNSSLARLRWLLLIGLMVPLPASASTCGGFTSEGYIKGATAILSGEVIAVRQEEGAVGMNAGAASVFVDPRRRTGSNVATIKIDRVWKGDLRRGDTVEVTSDLQNGINLGISFAKGPLLVRAVSDDKGRLLTNACAAGRPPETLMPAAEEVLGGAWAPRASPLQILERFRLAIDDAEGPGTTGLPRARRLSALFRLIGDSARDAKAWRQASASDPGVEATFGVGRALFDGRRFADAIPYLQSSLGDGAPPEAPRLLSQSRFHAGQEKDIAKVDFEGFTSESLDLTGRTAEGLSMERARISRLLAGKSVLRGLRAKGFSGSVLAKDADLTGIDLRNATGTLVAPGGSLRGADLTEATLSVSAPNADLRDLRASNLQARSLDMTGAKADGARLDGAALTFARLGNATLRGADLSGASLDGADLTGTDMTGANLTGVKLAGATYDCRTRFPEGFAAGSVAMTPAEGQCPGVRLDLTGQTLSGLPFGYPRPVGGTVISNGQINHPPEARRNLAGGILRDVFLKDADMSVLNLAGADLSGLRGYGTFSGSDLTGAKLVGADLRFVTFNGKNGPAILAGVDFSKARIPANGLTPAEWDNVKDEAISVSCRQPIAFDAPPTAIVSPPGPQVSDALARLKARVPSTILERTCTAALESGQRPAVVPVEDDEYRPKEPAETKRLAALRSRCDLRPTGREKVLLVNGKGLTGTKLLMPKMTGEPVSQLDVVVEGDRPVSLILFPDRGVLFNLTGKVENVSRAIVVTDYAAVRGLPADKVVFDVPSECGLSHYAHMASGKADALRAQVSRALPQAKVDDVAAGIRGFSVTVPGLQVAAPARDASRPFEPMGLRFPRMSDVAPGDALGPEGMTESRTAPGANGLADLEKAGIIRKPTADELNRYAEAIGGMVATPLLPGWKPTVSFGYAVTGPMEFPSGLHGGYSTSFLILPGVPYPTGNPGHSCVQRLDQPMKDMGMTCRFVGSEEMQKVVGRDGSPLAPAGGRCSTDISVPPGASVVSVNGYSVPGRRQSGGHERQQASVRVEKPGDVVLALGAYEPIDWRIELAPGSRLVGVAAVGYHEPKVEGAGDAPVARSWYGSKSACGYEGAWVGPTTAPGLVLWNSTVRGMTGADLTQTLPLAADVTVR